MVNVLVSLEGVLLGEKGDSGAMVINRGGGEDDSLPESFSGAFPKMTLVRKRSSFAPSMQFKPVYLLPTENIMRMRAKQDLT